MSFADDVARVLARAGLSGPGQDKAQMRRMAAAAYEAAYVRRAAESGERGFVPGAMFNSCLDMLDRD